MPPLAPKDMKASMQEMIQSNEVVIFSKTTCPYCNKVKALFDSLKIKYKAVEVNLMEYDSQFQDALTEFSGQRTVPNVFINGNHVGGHSETVKLHESNKLVAMVTKHSTDYEYDLVVIGGGSGGLAAAKQAATLGQKVACLDFVQPTPLGTTWGLGGTCVNVGCIPKKLMHQAAILGHSLDDARSFGWNVPEKIEHDWVTMRDAIQAHIGSLNWNYRVQLRSKNVVYLNSYATFLDQHAILAVNKKGKEEKITAEKFLLATGGRPNYPDIPGAKEYCITSDDLFSLPNAPGKTLVIGASYVALECAGFLAALGYDTTVMVRSILLRGFDQQCAGIIEKYMKAHRVTFVRPCTPSSVKKNKSGSLLVTGQFGDGSKFSGEFNTVLVAIGRDPCTSKIGLDKVGIKLDSKGFVIASDDEQTNVNNIYAIGDILAGRPELTPVAIHAGRLLAKRLFAQKHTLTDYVNVPTTVFTPLEYGCIGLSEEDALKKYGEQDVEVYHSYFRPLEWTVPKREESICYAKLVCLISENERVVGLHVLGPNAGEITQGWALGIKMGATKSHFNSTIGIHPTSAEIFTTLFATKRSGEDVSQAGC